MRAFMSEPDGGPAWLDEIGPPAGQIFRTFAGDWALAEARRILAETEAGGLETFTHGHHRFEGDYVKTELSRNYDGQGHSELAEALRAFVEAP